MIECFLRYYRFSSFYLLASKKSYLIDVSTFDLHYIIILKFVTYGTNCDVRDIFA